MTQDIQNFSDYWSVRSDTYSATVIDDINEGLADNWMQHVRPRMAAGRLKILDVGTGPGFFPMMFGKDHDVTAVDFSEGMLAKAAENCKAKGVPCRFMHMNAEELEFEPETFDMVVSRNVLWNLPHPVKALEGIMKVLKKGGKMFIFDGSYSKDDEDDEYPENPTEEQKKRDPYMRYPISKEMSEKFAALTSEGLPLREVIRPEWDISVLRNLGISSIEVVFTDNFNFHPRSKDRNGSRYFMYCATKRDD